MTTDHDNDHAMTVAGFSARGRWMVAPFLRAATEPIRWIDVSAAFGIKPADMHRVATAFRVLREKWGMDEAFAAEQLLRVGPLLAMHVGIDIDDAATAIGILFRAGSHSPGAGLYSAVVKSARDRGSARAHYEHIECAVHRYGEPAAATWKATVLPMLQRAMAKRPELRGAKVKLETAAVLFEVKVHGEGWDWTMNLRRGPLVADIEADCESLASAAALKAAAYLAAKKDAGGCDVKARILRGRMPLSDDEPAAVPAANKDVDVPPTVPNPNRRPWKRIGSGWIEQPSASERTPLPVGWSWNDWLIGASCGALSAGLACNGSLMLSEQAADQINIRLALYREAQRIGHPWLDPVPTCERTPLPFGWRWNEEFPLCADGPQGDYVVVESSGHLAGLVFDRCRYRDRTPAVLDAMRTEAARLGLAWIEPCAQQEVKAPVGYTFKRASYPYEAAHVTIETSAAIGRQHVFASHETPQTGSWLALPEHCAAFDWAKRLLAEGGAS